MDIESRVKRIDGERHAQGLSMQQFADMCQLSASTVSRTLAGKTTPTDYTLHAMEEALGITDRPADNPILDLAQADPMLERYINMQDVRIGRMRAHYNMLLAEKNRWIRLLFLMCIALVLFICVVLVMDVLHPDIGWIRQQLDLSGSFFGEFLRSVNDLLQTFV